MRTSLPSCGVSESWGLLFSIRLSAVDLMGTTQLFCFIKQNRMNYYTICTKLAGDGVNMFCLTRNSHPYWLTELSHIKVGLIDYCFPNTKKTSVPLLSDWTNPWQSFSIQ